MHNTTDFTHEFDVPADTTTTFDAAADPQAWWNELISGSARHVGDTFVFQVPGLHYSKFQVTEASLGERLTWKVIPSGNDAELTEWLDTDVIFDFAPGPAGTRIAFAHVGLRPELECHSVCSTAWRYHLTAGLQAMLSGEAPAPITPATIDQVAETVGARRAIA